MITVFKTPFEVQAGDQIEGTKGILTVIEATGSAASIGGAILARHGLKFGQGDRYSVKMRREDGSETGISGRWDGESGFKVLVNPRYPVQFQGRTVRVTCPED
jgi:hypothetical protein